MALNRRWSDAQRDAIREATTRDGLSAPRIVELAAAGKLAGLPAFEIPLGTVRSIATKAKRRAEGEAIARTPLDRTVTQSAEEVARMLARATRRYKRREDAGKLTPKDVSELARATRDVQAMLDALPRGTSAAAPAADHDTTRPQETTLDTLARDLASGHEEGSEAAQPEPDTTTTKTGEETQAGRQGVRSWADMAEDAASAALPGQGGEDATSSLVDMGV